MESSLSKLSRKSDTTAAVRYALARWDAFVRYCDDGRIEIDNSAAERALRAVAPGGRTTCLRDRIAAEIVPQPFIVRSEPAS